MNKYHYQRMLHAGGIALVVTVIAWLIVSAISEGMHLYRTPSEVRLDTHDLQYVGGRVVQGSLVQSNGHYQFEVEDDHTVLSVQYDGLLPALFKEGRDTVMTGRMQQGRFEAKQVLAKHDEYYRPADVQAEVDHVD